jgi:chromosome segregation ATPase
MAKKKTTVVSPEIIEENAEKIEITDINLNIDEVKESIESVETIIESNVEDEIKELSQKIEEQIKPIAEIEEKLGNLGDKQQELNKVLSEDPSKAQKYLENEIKKAEELKNAVEKIISTNSTRTMSKSSMINWWNGTGYDTNLW